MSTNNILEFVKEEERLVSTLMWAKENMSKSNWDVLKNGKGNSEEMNYIWGVNDLVISYGGFLDWFDISDDLKDLTTQYEATSKN